MIHVTLSGDIFLKSRRTQRGLVRRVLDNLEHAVRRTGVVPSRERVGGHRFALAVAEERVPAVTEAACRVFGVASVDRVVELAGTDLEDLASEIAARAAPRVAGRTFAVRVRRRGRHEWRSPDLAARAGALLCAAGGTVDLGNPEETVQVTVLDERAFLVEEHHAGPGGLPLGSQDPVLALVSGGFDSAVAAWMLMSRGSPVEYVHFTLNCAQSDHALAVAHTLWERWGAGTVPMVHLVEFQPVKEALLAEVRPQMRQVALKVLMSRAAERIAAERRITALVTGDALGQVSSQTLPHLVAVSRAVRIPILRPLLGMRKEEIIARARRIGTAEISARAREVCDLSEGGPVATSATLGQVAGASAQVPDALMEDAVATRKTFALGDWSPGTT